MSKSKIVVLDVLVLFAGLNAWAAYRAGLAGLVDLVRDARPWTWVILADLAIALGLVLAWLHRDARARGASFLPWFALTLTTGSIGPLLYLARRRA